LFGAFGLWPVGLGGAGGFGHVGWIFELFDPLIAGELEVVQREVSVEVFELIGWEPRSPEGLERGSEGEVTPEAILGVRGLATVMPKIEGFWDLVGLFPKDGQACDGEVDIVEEVDALAHDGAKGE